MTPGVQGRRGQAPQSPETPNSSSFQQSSGPVPNSLFNSGSPRRGSADLLLAGEVPIWGARRQGCLGLSGASRLGRESFGKLKF